MNTPLNTPSFNACGFLGAPTRFLFFTGKGGVGKTSLSTATAIALADAGPRALRVKRRACRRWGNWPLAQPLNRYKKYSCLRLQRMDKRLF